ncbi:MAG TPA: RNA 2',3'-cyclic phosphodiesterase [Anaerolineae bacterium]|nr:RNA 2',3'-cyclic phosphodiesterase [Anaerolineae bacterium]
MDAIRTFIAIELPQAILDQLSEIQARLKSAVPGHAMRWVKPDSIHLTLKFLGQTPDDQIGLITSSMKAGLAGHPAFTLEISGAGCYPTVQRPRVIWIGVHEDQNAKHLSAVQHAVESSIAPLGYPTERRDFSPHLTLGRVSHEVQPADLKKIGAAIGANAVGLLGRFEVIQVALIRSDLKPHGAVYTILARAPLKS